MGKWGMILLAVWLILTGLMPLLNVRLSSAGLLLSVLAAAAGVLIFMSQWPLSLSRNLGMLLLAIWLIATGAMALFGLSFANSGLIMGLLATAAGILILLKR